MKKQLNIAIIFLVVIGFSFNSWALFRDIPDSKEQVIYSYSSLVKKATPAVVNIYTKKRVKVQTGFSPFFNDPLFQNFFAKTPGGIITERVENSLGSGVIVKSNGLIITNNHVIAGGEDVRVVLHDKREFEAKVILADPKTDLALLKIDVDGEVLNHLELMDSDKLEVGDIVLAIGNPFGVGQTVTSGIVSALARATVGISDYEFFIQTDASINPGNSGGALINMEGKLAGINTAIFTKSGGSQGIGFAIPANMVATVLNNKGGKIVRPWLGLYTQEITQDIADSLGLKTPSGALISELAPNSPAGKAGLKVGDIVIKLDGKEIEDGHALNFRIAMYKIGSDAEFTVIRSGKEQNISIKMAAAPEITEKDFHKITGKNPLTGATIANLSPALADDLGLRGIYKGVVITKIEAGPAAGLGIIKGDILKNVNGQEVTSVNQLIKFLKGQEKDQWQIAVQRGNQLLNITYRGKL